MTSPDWTAAWMPMQQAVGREFGEGRPEVWGEVIEAGAVRRYIEPLELGCALHNDAGVARKHGHANITVPFTALASFALPLLWRTGETPLFTDAGRDAQPVRSHIGGILFGLEPPTTHFFAVDSEADFLKPAVVGDRLCRRGAFLLSCIPKQTRLGRGAFIGWQTEVINQHRELLARLRTTFFRYNPHPAGAPP
jgi:hypothetical protein